MFSTVNNNNSTPSLLHRHGNELIIRNYLSTSVGQSEMGIQSVARAPRKREMEFVSSLDHFLLYFITSLARGWPILGLDDRDLGKHWQTLMELIRSDCSVTRCPSESDQTRRYTHSINILLLALRDQILIFIVA